MKSKTNWQARALESNRILVMAALFATVLLTVLFLINVSQASAALIEFGPECQGCHETSGDSEFGCGVCHKTETTTLKTGSHETHFNADSKGPGIALCDTCHGAGADDGTHDGHRNGIVNFTESSITVIAPTGVCDSCHSPGGTFDGVDSGAGSVGAKDNWATGVYTGLNLASGKEMWCVGCHDTAGSTIGVETAKNISGDDSSYGFYEAGHGLEATSTYDRDSIGDTSGNQGAGKGCVDCHDVTKDHINDVNDTSVLGQRIQDNINGLAIAGLQDVCKNCHQVTSGTPSTVKAASHGNTTDVLGFNNPTEENFSVLCLSCHNPHSSDLNAESTKNLKMVKPDVQIATGVVGDVVFKNTSGANSFDENDTESTDPDPVDLNQPNNDDDICVTCHVNSNNPNYPMISHSGAYGHNPSNSVDKREQNCTTNCHEHDLKGDGVVNIADGFVPGGSGACGTCHDAWNSTLKTGGHETHFPYSDTADPMSLKGPGSLTCDVCHGAGASFGLHAGHQNGTPNFLESASTTLGVTGACNTCHSSGGGYNGVNSTGSSIGAKDSWATGVYSSTATLTGGNEKWCVGCHDDAPSVILVGETTSTSGTLMTAQSPGGDGSGYGAYVNGHSKAAGTYDKDQSGVAGGNSAANRECGVCHDFTTQHLNTSNDTDTSGQRIEGTINGQAVASVDDACKACHQNGVGKQSSDHGNTGESYSAIEGAMSAVGCANCHEGHGNNENTASNRNLRMIRNDVQVVAGTTAAVVYESTTGTDSLDEADGSDGDDLCAACHSNGSNPGSPTVRHDGGDHSTTDTASIFNGAPGSISDKRGDDCTICHRHDYQEDSNVSANNGFMPMFYQTLPGSAVDTCVSQACHATSTIEQTTGSHTSHADAVKGPGATATCDTCHGVGAGSDGSHTGHDNGVENFADGNPLSTTIDCNSCHSPNGGYNGVDSTATSVGAKDNWDLGVYDDTTTLSAGKAKWCVGCHDNAPSTIPTAGGATAPDVGGDASTYGAYVAGHSKTSGNYDEAALDDATGNVAANKICGTCHNLGAQHLNGVDGTGTAGQRINSSINGTTTAGSVYNVCKACHQNAEGTQVSSHGNSAGDGYSAIEGGFGIECMSCHESHGNSLNASSSRNLKMIRRDTKIGSGSTTGDVDFRSTTGLNSFDESDAADGDDICASCHSNAANTGYAMTRHDGGDHDTTDPASVFYGAPASVTDKRGDECTTCHKHDYKANVNVANEDGFMPSMETPGGACGSGTCHDATTQTVSTGSHQSHFTGNKGPDIATCDTCHGPGSGAGSHVDHFNGTVDFADGNVLGATNACDTCHSPAGGFNGVSSTGSSIGAKDNWTTGVYSSSTTLTVGKEKWCVGCHDSAPSVIVVSGTTMTAPVSGGDDSGYGAYINGHSKDTSSYDKDQTGVPGGNSAANRECGVCHDLSTQHLNTSNDTDTSGQRIEGTINGQAVASVDDACKACHQNGVGKQSSDHGNTGESYSAIEGAMSAVGCANCHEGHGNNKNTTGDRNLRMIREDVIVTAGTTTAVVYEATTGTDSLDEADGSNADDLCAACHSNGSNPGSPTVRHDGGDHSTTDTASIFNGAPGSISDKRGDDCTICHRHDYNAGSVAPNNGFMPMFYQTLPGSAVDTCDSQACHATSTIEQTTGSHTSHADSVKGPGATATCDTCHGVGAGSDGSHTGHDNGVENFADGNPLSTTIDCNSCHSPNGGYNGVDTTATSVGAKDNWDLGVYDDTTTLSAGKAKWCVGCHDNAPSTIPTAGGATAPDVGGDASTYGAYVAGHSKTSGNYDEAALDDATGNVAANRACGTCHDLGSQHLNGTDGTGTAGQRVESTINGQAISVVSDACEACHQNETSAALSASVNARVSQHGNSQLAGYTPQVESTFTVSSCVQCHGLHGNILNTNSNRNLKMIKGPVIISGSTTGAVVFENRTGADSFDESDTVGTQDNDDICATCHTNAANPGNPMNMHVGGLHDGGGFGSDERGNDCISCHKHNYLDGPNTAVDDGFMPGGGACGSCHDAFTNTLTSGSHVTHFTYGDTSDTQSLKGPGLTTCDTCHGIGAGAGTHAGHQNGTKNFAEGAATALAATNICNICHSPNGGYDGVDDPIIGAKNNWPVGVYSSTATLTGAKEQWCVGCHDDVPSVINVGGTTMTAPPTGGDGSTYGAYINGHDTTSGTYDDDQTGVAGGNAAANQECGVCHDLTTQHLNQVDGTDTTGQRMESQINSRPITSINSVCKACHQNSVGIQVSTHSNSASEGYSPIEGPRGPTDCADCHEGHGVNNNTASNRNLRMIRNDVKVVDGTTVPIVYESTTGLNSLDESDAVDSDDLCAACHENANNPGNPMVRHDGGDHTTTDTASIFYTMGPADSDKRGEDCTACHRHDYLENGNVFPNNGFMPASYSDVGCGSLCHQGSTATMNTGSHETHFNNTRGPGITTCDTCHGVNSGIGTHTGHYNGIVDFAN